MLRNGAASLHGSTNVQKVCRIHEGRGHLRRRQLTSRAFNARVHSSMYIYSGGGSPPGPPSTKMKNYYYTSADPGMKCTRSKLSAAQVAAAFVDPTDLLYVC